MIKGRPQVWELESVAIEARIKDSLKCRSADRVKQLHGRQRAGGRLIRGCCPRLLFLSFLLLNSLKTLSEKPTPRCRSLESFLLTGEANASAIGGVGGGFCSLMLSYIAGLWNHSYPPSSPLDTNRLYPSFREAGGVSFLPTGTVNLVTTFPPDVRS